MCLTTAMLSIVLAVNAQAVAQSQTQARVADLIARLGHPDFKTREAATRDLIAVGEPALAALRTASSSTDVEVARRASALHDKIIRSVENERILGATLVEVDATDVPLATLAVELEKQTGYRLSLTGSGLASKTVTVKTNGKVPFWEALTQVCETAGIEVASVRPGQPSPRPLAGGPVPGGMPDLQKDIADLANRRQAAMEELRKQVQETLKEAEKAAANGNNKKIAEQLRRRQAEMEKILQMLALEQARQQIAGRNFERPSTSPGTIVLRERTGQSNPACLSGAVRIEALPQFPVSAAALPRDTAMVYLRTIAEPRLDWERVESVRVTRAIDSQGRSLKGNPLASQTLPVRQQQIAGGSIVIDARGGVNLLPNQRSPSRQAPPNTRDHALVQVKCDPDQPPGRLKVLEGTIRALVRPGPRTLAVLDGLKPNGPAVAGGNGVTLQTTGVNPAGELEVSIHYDPKAVQPAGSGTPSVTERVVEQGRGRVIVRQQVGGVIVFGGNAPQDLMRSDSSESTAFGLQVFDKDGKPLKASITRSVRKFDQSGIVTDTIKLKVKDGEPSKVSFTGSQSRVVEVPFRLTDVAVTVGTSPESGGQR